MSACGGGVVRVGWGRGGAVGAGEDNTRGGRREGGGEGGEYNYKHNFVHVYCSSHNLKRITRFGKITTH